MKKKLLITLTTILLLTAILFVLEKTRVINLYERLDKSPTQSETSTRPVNDVDYSPASSTDNDDINKKKENGEIIMSPGSQDTSIQITFIASNQDVIGGPISLGAIVSGVTDGTCEYTLRKDSLTIKKEASIIAQTGYYSCVALEIPYSELVNGSWDVKLSVTSSDGRTNASTAAVEVR